MKAKITVLPIVLSLAAGASAARAEGARASLVVTRDDGARDCPDASALALRINEIVGTDVVEDNAKGAPTTWLQVEMNRSLESYTASIRTQGARSGSRVITDVGPGCGNLAEATAVALAVLLDELTPPPTTTNPAPARPPSPVPAPPHVEPPSRTAPPPPTSQKRDVDWTLGAAFDGGVAFSILSQPALVLEGSASIRYRDRFGLSLSGGAFAPDTITLPDGQLEVGLAYFGARACAVFLDSAPSLALEACAGPMLGWLSGAPSDFDENIDRTAPFGAVAGGVQARSRITGPLSWSARALAVVPFVRSGFTVVRDGEPSPAFTVPRAGALLMLGLFYGGS